MMDMLGEGMVTWGGTDHERVREERAYSVMNGITQYESRSVGCRTQSSVGHELRIGPPLSPHHMNGILSTPSFR